MPLAWKPADVPQTGIPWLDRLLRSVQDDPFGGMAPAALRGPGGPLSDIETESLLREVRRRMVDLLWGRSPIREADPNIIRQLQGPLRGEAGTGQLPLMLRGYLTMQEELPLGGLAVRPEPTNWLGAVTSFPAVSLKSEAFVPQTEMTGQEFVKLMWQLNQMGLWP